MAIPTLIGYGMTIAHPIGIRSRCNPIRLIIFSFVFIGDVQDTLRGKTRGFMENVRHRYPQADFYMFAGDFAERPMNCYWDEAYQSVDSIAPTKPILVSPGNHEYVKGLVRVLEKRFALCLFLSARIEV